MKIPESLYAVIHTAACRKHGRVKPGPSVHTYPKHDDASWEREALCRNKDEAFACRLIRYDRQEEGQP